MQFSTTGLHRLSTSSQLRAAGPPAPPENWLYPAFGSIVDTVNTHVTKNRSSMGPGPNPIVYTLQEGFLPEDRSWIKFVRDEHMFWKSNVFYRPEIVK